MNWELLFIFSAVVAAACYLLRYFWNTFAGKGGGCRCESASCATATPKQEQRQTALK